MRIVLKSEGCSGRSRRERADDADGIIPPDEQAGAGLAPHLESIILSEKLDRLSHQIGGAVQDLAVGLVTSLDQHEIGEFSTDISGR